MTAVVGLLMAVLVASPALAAMDEHAMSHAASPVEATEHHHHGEEGQIEIGDPVAPDDDQSDGDDGGHFHLPSGCSGLAGLVGSGPAVLALLTAPAMHFAFVERPHSSLGAEPQIRPPQAR